MGHSAITRRARRRGAVTGALATGALVLALAVTVPAAAGQRADRSPRAQIPTLGLGRPVTPIQHVIVIIGENHSFDNVFATYQPEAGQTIRNLLSEKIVNADGTPGPNYSRAIQVTATDTKVYQITPKRTGTYSTLPPPNTTYVKPACDGGQPNDSPDARFPALPDGPFQITKYVPYADKNPGCLTGAWVGDPIHRFYQMYQQVGSGKSNQYVWVANTAGDDNGAIPPAPIYQGGLSMGFYNMAQGDAPLLKTLAESYAISDNYHQPAMGGTGLNHILLYTGDDYFYSDGNGNPLVPPANQVEDPNPKPGTNNNYQQDGYSGGSYTDCSSPGAPGVAAVMARLDSQPYAPWHAGNCAPGHFYILNNYNPAYKPNGTRYTSPFTVPPQTVPTIADELTAHGISWRYFGQGLTLHQGAKYPYCNICNGMEYSKTIMTNPTLRGYATQTWQQFLSDAHAGTLPAVSFLKPSSVYDGHPASSTLYLFEKFVHEALNAVMSNSTQWASTAVFITMDESGGYYDSGYVQPIDYFGDGPRVPLITVSPWARPGYVDHTYTDHVSILKFIEANWRLSPLSGRSRDNLPNPVQNGKNPYVPANRPAIGDLMTQFDFSGPPRLAVPSLPNG